MGDGNDSIDITIEGPQGQTFYDDIYAGIAGGSSIVSTTPYDTLQIQLPPTVDDFMRSTHVQASMLFSNMSLDRQIIETDPKALEDRIKGDLLRQMLDEIKKKTKFTKLDYPHEQNTQFRAKVYVFSEEQLRNLIEYVRNQ